MLSFLSDASSDVSATGRRWNSTRRHLPLRVDKDLHHPASMPTRRYRFGMLSLRPGSKRPKKPKTLPPRRAYRTAVQIPPWPTSTRNTPVTRLPPNRSLSPRARQRKHLLEALQLQLQQHKSRDPAPKRQPPGTCRARRHRGPLRRQLNLLQHELPRRFGPRQRRSIRALRPFESSPRLGQAEP